MMTCGPFARGGEMKKVDSRVVGSTASVLGACWSCDRSPMHWRCSASLGRYMMVLVYRSYANFTVGIATKSVRSHWRTMILCCGPLKVSLRYVSR